MSDVNADTVLNMLRQLTPRERLKVIAQALPEIEKTLAEQSGPLKSLLGLWADLGPSPSSEDIDQARQEFWRDFPREGI